jgi:glycosyltransferase involved in cell wall biosynthesis
MRIAMLGQYPSKKEIVRGGVETCIIGLVNELKKYSDLELHIVTTDVKTKNITTIEGNLAIYYLSSPSLPRFVTATTIDKYKIIKQIKKLQPDIVHAHMTGQGYYALRSGFPTVITVHGIAKEEYDPKIQPGLLGMLRRRAVLPMEHYVFEHAKILAVVSPYVKAKIEPFCKGEIHVIPNGVRDEFFEIENEEIENRLLFVGGIEPRKGLLNMLKVIEMVKRDIHDVRLHIVGRVRKHQYFTTLEDYVKQNNLEGNIIFKGELTDVELKKEYSECSLFVFPSKEESFGIVLAEAAASGKPVVASNIGGIPYVVDNNETGFLVKYGDVKTFAEKISILLTDKNLRRQMGNAGKEKAKQFSNKKLAERYYTLYNLVIDDKNE